MYQARRDSLIMKKQRTMDPTKAEILISLHEVSRCVSTSTCDVFNRGGDFDSECSVFKSGKVVDCARMPLHPCHVKNATTAFSRTGDMGKVPTSAFERIWRNGGLGTLVDEIKVGCTPPAERASRLVDLLSSIFRIGRKLASLFVSALCTPSLAPNYSVLSPHLDGNDILVIDTNVMNGCRCISGSGLNTSGVSRFIRSCSRSITLSDFHPSLPSHSPRMIQQSIYHFYSKSNRTANSDPCLEEGCQ